MLMATFLRFRRHLHRLARSESGMALPTAIFAMIASMGFAGVAVISSINAQRGTHRDHDSKNAIAAADAGADVALLRLNRFQSNLSLTKQCIGPGGETLVPTAGWCPMTSAESVGDATFRYQVSAYQPGSELRVVSTGQAGPVGRRIEVGLISYNGEEVFADERMIGQDGINVSGTPDIRTDVGTNGSVTKNGSGTLCGDVRHGVGKTAPTPDCGGKIFEGNKDLPPIVLPINIATTANSNCRLSATCAKSSEVDTYSKKTDKTSPWDAVRRTINVNSNATLTMGGGDYFVCGLYVNNGQVIMAGGVGVQVRIFFDTPENCGFKNGDTQVSIGGNANIVSTGYNPSKGMFNVPGLYVQGSTTIQTNIDLSGGSGTNELILYAPNSHIDMGGNSTWIGMMAGKSINLHGTPRFESDPGIDVPDIYFTSLWEPTHYVECTGPSASPPDASC